MEIATTPIFLQFCMSNIMFSFPYASKRHLLMKINIPRRKLLTVLDTVVLHTLKKVLKYTPLPSIVLIAVRLVKIDSLFKLSMGIIKKLYFKDEKDYQNVFRDDLCPFSNSIIEVIYRIEI